VPRRYQSGEVDYTGGISKCDDGRVRTLLYEAANVMLTRYKGQLKLKNWPSPSPSDQRCAKRGSLWLAGSQSSCMRCCETGQSSSSPKPFKPRDRRPNLAPKRSDALGREQTTARILLQGPKLADCDFNLAALHPAYPTKCRTSTQRTQAPESVDTPRASALDPLENRIRRLQTSLAD
jgi:Transposase IS116/IS110/IS902 family